MHYTTRTLAAGAALALLGMWASGSPPQAASSQMEESFERYNAYAGPPIEEFTWLGNFYSWEPLGKDRLVVFTTPSDAYLLKVWPPCDLRFVINSIGLTSTARTVHARLDSITVNGAGTGPGGWRCPIEEIRKVDYKGLRAAMKADLKAAKEKRAAAQGEAQQSPAQASQPSK